MLYHWTDTDEATAPTDVEPRESPRSVVVQIAFTGTFLLLGILGYVTLVPVFSHFVD